MSWPASCLPNSVPARSRSAAAERPSSAFSSSRSTASAFSSAATAPARSLPSLAELGRGLGQVRLGLAQLRRLEVGEHGIGGEGRGGLADGRLAIAQRRPCRLAIAGLLRGEGPGVVHHVSSGRGPGPRGRAGGRPASPSTLRWSMANRDQPSSRRSSLTIRSSWPSVSRICRSRASLSWKSRSSASSTLRRCSSLASSSRISVSALAELGVLEHLVRLVHLLEDQLLARELEGQPEPRGVLGLEAAEGLGEAEHPLFQLGHLGRGVLLGEADRVAVGDAAGLAGLARFALASLAAGLLVVEDALRLVGLRGRRCLGERPRAGKGESTAITSSPARPAASGSGMRC